MMLSYPASWSLLPVGEVVRNITLTEKKIPQKHYLSSGKFPVFDQGQEYVGGYTDDAAMLVECDLPVIVFGDHTRAVKLVNTAFAPGADGVKVLQPTACILPKLLEQFVRYLVTKIPNNGYARHYQHLAKSLLPIPPLPEQHRIVAKIEELFSELDQGVASLKTARAQLKVYRQSLLKNAFSGKLTAKWRAAHRDQLETAAALQQRIASERAARYQQQLADWQAAGQAGPKPKAPKPLPPLTPEELAELPDRWVALAVEQFCEIEDGDRGDHYPTKADFSGSGYCLFLNAKNVTKRGFVFQETSFISYEKHLALRKGTLKRGDMVFTSRGTLGNIALYDDSVPFECVRLNSGMFIIRGYDAALTPDFLYYHLNAPLVTRQIELLQSGTAQPQLPIREFKSFRLVIPSKREQLAIVQELESKLSEADQLDQTLASALQQAEALRQSILKKAFCGQLVPQDQNDEPAAALLERIRAGNANGINKPGRKGKIG